MSRAINIKIDEALYYSNRGLCYYNLEVYDTALLNFKTVLDLDSVYYIGYWNLAMANYNLEQYERAIIAFNKSEDIGYVNGELYNYRGICYYNLENYDSALADFLKATKSKNPLLNFFGNLGDTYLELGDSKRAIGAFKKAIQIDSTYATGHNSIGLEYYMEESYDAAITQSIAINATEAVYFDNRRKAKDAKIDYLGAIKDYSQSISLYPEDSYIYYLRGNAKSNLNNKFDACKDFKKAAEIGLEKAQKSLEEYCITSNE